MVYRRHLADRFFESYARRSLIPYYHYIDSRVDHESARKYLDEYQKATSNRHKIITDILSMSDCTRNVFDALLNSRKEDLYGCEKDLLWLRMTYGEEEFLEYCIDTEIEYNTQQTISGLVSDYIGMFGDHAICAAYMEEEMINNGSLYYNPTPIDVRFVCLIHPSNEPLIDTRADTIYKYVFHGGKCSKKTPFTYRINETEGVLAGQCIWKYYGEETQVYAHHNNKKMLKTTHLQPATMLYSHRQLYKSDPVAFTTLMDILDKVAPELLWLESKGPSE